MVADVLEASFTTEAALVPNFSARLDETTFALQDEHRFSAGRTVALRSTVSSEARSTQKSGARTNIVDGETRTNGCGIGVYSGIGRKGRRAERTYETREGFLRLEHRTIGLGESGAAVEVW